MPDEYVFHGVIHPKQARVNVPDEMTTTIQRGEHQGEAEVHINASKVTVLFELEGELENLPTLRNLVENIVQGIVDPICFLNGSLLTIEISSVVLPSGGCHTFGSRVPELEDIGFEGTLIDEVSRMMALYDGDSGNYLRLAVADFNMAMRFPHETGFFCFRAIESMRQHFYTQERSDNESWQAMRNTLDIEREDIDYIQQFADDRRHGDLVDVPGQSRREMLYLSWNMIRKFIDHLDENA